MFKMILELGQEVKVSVVAGSTVTTYTVTYEDGVEASRITGTETKTSCKTLLFVLELKLLKMG